MINIVFLLNLTWKPKIDIWKQSIYYEEFQRGDEVICITKSHTNLGEKEPLEESPEKPMEWDSLEQE